MLALIAAIVRPWKLSEKTMMRAASGAIPFLDVAPAAREFDRRFYRFDAGIHEKGFVVSARARQLLQQTGHAIVVHRPRRQRYASGLFDERRLDARMAVARIERRVGADAIEIAFAGNVGQPNAFRPRDDEIERRIVVSAVALLARDQLARSLREEMHRSPC